MVTNRSRRRQPARTGNQRGGKSKARRAPVIRPVAPPPRPAEPSSRATALGFLLVAVGGTAYFVLFAYQESSARGWVDGMRALTGGRSWAMTIAGWLTIIAIFGLAWALILLRKRIHRNWLWAIGVVIAALLPTVLALIPYQGHYIVHLISGPGGGAFVTGMRWASAAGFIPFVVVPFVVLNENLKRRFGTEELRGKTAALVVLFAIVTLISALVSA
ncbi:hypothetical protein Ait01nite_018140 [Actinoplanes italicus]|uniref:Uncharacterized protein n=1 Tax=Actinoplanes italicus TaxID=113567 RepID=A0A2T0KPX1_9ACTN|nr:hypothetical protein [Actinoplanes italicus]PRX25780.1 hypothetical protein CLV67_101500 [Actinoplanes italicus]GIE28769.1 hypothetical protein Ait01nite_018140 [Actinoplanes italicus]